MEEYADYNFYQSEYGGKSVSEDEFTPLLKRATFYINAITRNRITEISTAVSMATCAAVDYVKQNSESNGKNIISESVGVWSRSYAGDVSKTFIQLLYDAVRPYLINTELLYGGID